jgi:hypothetical protein
MLKKSRVVLPAVSVDKSGVKVAVPVCTYIKYKRKVMSSYKQSHQLSANKYQKHVKLVSLRAIGARSILIDKSTKLSKRLITQHIND